MRLCRRRSSGVIAKSYWENTLERHPCPVRCDPWAWLRIKGGLNGSWQRFMSVPSRQNEQSVPRSCWISTRVPAKLRGPFNPHWRPDMTVLEHLSNLSSAEDFFRYLEVPFEPAVLNVARLHIL